MVTNPLIFTFYPLKSLKCLFLPGTPLLVLPWLISSVCAWSVARASYVSPTCCLPVTYLPPTSPPCPQCFTPLHSPLGRSSFSKVQVLLLEPSPLPNHCQGQVWTPWEAPSTYLPHLPGPPCHHPCTPRYQSHKPLVFPQTCPAASCLCLCTYRLLCLVCLAILSLSLKTQRCLFQEVFCALAPLVHASMTALFTTWWFTSVSTTRLSVSSELTQGLVRSRGSEGWMSCVWLSDWFYEKRWIGRRGEGSFSGGPLAWGRQCTKDRFDPAGACRTLSWRGPCGCQGHVSMSVAITRGRQPACSPWSCSEQWLNGQSLQISKPQC